MITNERQHRISKTQLENLKAAYDDLKLKTEDANDVLAKAELDSLASQCESLSDEISEYEALRSGTKTILQADSLAELPVLLIRARIARGLSQRELAEKLGLKEQQVQRYESEKYASAKLTRLVEIAESLNLDVSEIAQLRGSSFANAEPDLEWNKFPIAEMYRRNWFQSFTGTLETAKSAAHDLIQELARTAGRSTSPALFRQRVRANSKIDKFALLAWKWRVLTIARRRSMPAKFSRKALTNEWFNRLVRMSAQADGPLKAREFLAESGISLVIEPHLSHTHLDGAAFLGERGKPVVALTLRHDRIDNFWFVLLHELIHVRKHLRKGELEDVFDDLDGDADPIEQEADLWAGRALIPDEEWETALARYVQSEEATRQFAEELGISPAIVAGRVRNESGNYTILRDLVGYGDVRKQFPEARFAE